MMNDNVISLGNRFVNFGSADDAEMYYPVSLQEFEVPYDVDEYSDSYQLATADNFRAVVREDTGQVLAVHGKDYNLVRNEEIYPQFESALRQSSLDLTDMHTDVDVVDEGGAVVKSYIFPAHKIIVRGGDEVDLRLQVRNSYNGRWSFGTIFGGFRLICSNGMAIGHKFISDYGRHTKNLDVSASVDKLDRSVAIYLEHAEIWQAWAGKKVDDVSVQSLIDSFDFPDSFKTELLSAWRRQCAESGHQTVWEFFNALTAWATHGKMRSSSQATVTQMNRDNRVRQVINSREFRRLAA